LLVPLSAWIVGTIAFGLKPLQTPLGATFDNVSALTRIAIMTGYLAISLLFVAGLAFYLSVRTDAPLGAVGVAVGISILLNILDAITALGAVREWLPVHYAFSWFDALSITIDWSQMIRGASYCAMAGILFYALAIMKFAKKDVTS
jgi:ABC-2 type transport system permease protein